MKEKDFKLIYEDLYKKYIDAFIKEVEDLYKNCKEEGDAETFAYNDCKRLLNEKTIDLKIKRNSLSSIYRKFENRYSLIQNNNLNRLYIKHILPECKKFKIKMNEELYENLLNELAILDASKRVSSWFSCWYNVYKMMFELNDFSEFKIIRNCNYSESSDIFKKYHRQIYPSSYIIEEKIERNLQNKKSTSDGIKDEVKNFNLIEYYKKDFRLMYEDFIEYYIDGNKTSFEDYENVLFKNHNEHKSFITFSCSPQEAALLLFKLMEFFTDLTYTNIGKSKVFKNKSGKIITSTNYGKRVAPFNPKSRNLSLSAKQKTMLLRAENIIELIKKETFKERKS
ncbi:hypothetical protein MKD41_11540 [Lutibacter sp. A64]|uniref:hypothetical protein n=1 Tax=Lutibacter sp. A64 TaxID=2918526 RepID=UPI001F051FA4|nr:hypothetical protein [Lutibacter sp. A64]UMB52965.1 hypothetical protein MKD41_11540 [Lutibacter sp. A64]